MLDEEGDDMTDIVSAPRMVVTQFIRHHLPVSDVNVQTAELDSLVVQVRPGTALQGRWALGRARTACVLVPVARCSDCCPRRPVTQRH